MSNNPDLSEVFIEQVTIIREATGVSQGAIADKIGLTRSKMSRIMTRDKGKATIELLDKIASLYPIEELRSRVDMEVIKRKSSPSLSESKESPTELLDAKDKIIEAQAKTLASLERELANLDRMLEDNEGALREGQQFWRDKDVDNRRRIASLEKEIEELKNKK